MATLLSALETRLQHRLGIDTASTLEANRIREALNAAIAKVDSDGMPGSTSAFSAITRATTDLTVDVHTANTASLTVTDVIASEGIFPGDFFTDAAGQEYMIHSVVESTKTLGLGSPVETGITGTITVRRRSLELPNDGQVFMVHHDDDAILLDHSPSSRVRWSFETGRPDFYTQHYSEGQELSYISLCPAPSGSGDTYVIEQSKFRANLATGDNYDLPEPVLNAIVEEARNIMLAWSGPVNPVEAAISREQVKDFSDQTKNSGSAGAVLRRR